MTDRFRSERPLTRDERLRRDQAPYAGETLYRDLIRERLMCCQSEGEWLAVVAIAERLGWIPEPNVTPPPASPAATSGPASHG